MNCVTRRGWLPCGSLTTTWLNSILKRLKNETSVAARATTPKMAGSIRRARIMPLTMPMASVAYCAPRRGGGARRGGGGGGGDWGMGGWAATGGLGRGLPYHRARSESKKGAHTQVRPYRNVVNGYGIGPPTNRANPFCRK